MMVTKIRWDRKALRKVHGQPGVKVMLSGLADEMRDAATVKAVQRFGRFGSMKRKGKRYEESFVSVVERRRSPRFGTLYWVAQVRNTAPHAKFVEFGSVHQPPEYILIGVCRRWYGPR